MKIKIVCSEIMKKKFLEAIKEHTIDCGNQGELIVIEPHIDTNTLLVKEQEELVQIAIEDILYIDSYGNDILVHTQDDVYQARENLYTLEAQLYEKGFLRIHKSYIVNKRAIMRIRPSIHMKFQLVLTSQEVLEVTRSYYYAFKEEMGF